MPFLRNLPIARKLTLIVMITSCVALLLTCSAFVGYELLVFRRALVAELTIIARMVGDNSAAGLAFGDPDSVRQTLESLRAHPHVVAAAIYDPDGKLCATYARDAGAAFTPPPAEPSGQRFAERALHLFHTIDLAGEAAGTVYLQADLEQIRSLLRRYTAIGALVMLVASLVALLVSTKLLATISGPISDLAGIVTRVAKREDYSLRAIKRGEDELGRLMDGFNVMLDQIQARDRALQEARDNLERRVEERTDELRQQIREREQAEAERDIIHKQLIEASRRGGMAEIATNVLHNVGNVLTSVNVSASLVAESVHKSKATGLGRAVALLREHEHDAATFLSSDPKGKLLPGYLAQLGEHLLTDQRAVVDELESLRANIEHIRDIVAMQQSYAKVSGVLELVKVADLVEDSLRINFGALNRHGVTAVRDFAEVPPIEVDKNKVLQILVNLVRNAKYACDESGRADKRVTLQVAADDGRVKVRVIDNGVGIPPENLTRIFNHGFTTRANGHGFGLHSGALAAQEIGGALFAQSDGIGRGATFTLELPLQAPGDHA